LIDKGAIVMFLGYAFNHSADVYRFLKMGTKRVVLSRNVIWLNKLYCCYKISLKSNSLQSYFAEKEEVVDSIQKLSEEESLRLIEPAVGQEGEVRDVEDKGKSTAQENAEASDNRARPRASKNASYVE
jgi:hypothetical protein